MARLLLLALVSGCLGATSASSPNTNDEPPATESFQFHLAVHVFGGNGLLISAADGRASEHAFAEYKYDDIENVPELGVLPVLVSGVPLGLQTRACVDTTGVLKVVYEHVVIRSLEKLDDSDLYGQIGYDCTYAEGSTKSIPAAPIVFMGAGGTPL